MSSNSSFRSASPGVSTKIETTQDSLSQNILITPKRPQKSRPSSEESVYVKYLKIIGTFCIKSCPTYTGR